MAMAGTEAPSAMAEDQTGISWSDMHYPYALDRFSVMHYFEFSPFFNPNCNNTEARRKGLDPAVPNVLESLGPGLEYVLEVEQAPNMFVIRKQLRSKAGEGPGSTTPLAYYYIIDKVVYQAPNLHAILTARLRRCVWSIQEGFKKVQTDLDPILKLLKDEEKRKKKEEKQQEAAAAAASAEGGSGAAATTSSTKAAAAAAVPAQSHPNSVVPVRRRLPLEEAQLWRKTDNIVMSVLASYPRPELPPEYSQQPGPTAAAAAEGPAPPPPQPGAAPAPATAAATGAAAATPASGPQQQGRPLGAEGGHSGQPAAKRRR